MTLKSDTYFQLTKDGIPNPALRFGTEDECLNAIAGPGYGPGVYTCPKMKRVWDDADTAPPAPPVVPSVLLDHSTRFVAPAAMAKPAKGVTFTEPNFATQMTRITDHTADGLQGMGVPEYSRRKFWNCDTSLYLVYDARGAWWLYDAKTFAVKWQVQGPSGDSEPQWHPTLPNILRFLPTDGIGMTILETDVMRNVPYKIADLKARIQARWPQAFNAWSKSEGAPSADHRYWCFMVDDANYQGVGVVTYDLQTNTILGMYDLNGNRPDSVSMSPTGNYCIVSWANAEGTWQFNRELLKVRQLHTWSEHSDLALTADGDDAYVTIDYQDAAGSLFMVNLRTGARTPLLKTYVNGSATALHVSGKAYKKPGWVLVSTYAPSGEREWFHNVLLAVQLVPAPTIYRLGFTRMLYIPNLETSYYTEPHATVNSDFTKVAFGSNWDRSTSTDLDTYQIEIPSGSL